VDRLNEWTFNSVLVKLEIGPYDDSNMDYVVKSKRLGFMPMQTGGIIPGAVGPAIQVGEMTISKEVAYWPEVSLRDFKRRTMIYEAAKKALDEANRLNATEVGFFTVGLEVAGVPSWEVAEEIVRAVYDNSVNKGTISRAVLVAASPIQVSSFQYALNNRVLLTPE
jgi:hypothetical protein